MSAHEETRRPQPDEPKNDVAKKNAVELRIECERCGSEMYDSHCKVICPRCGYQRDCSDP